MRITYGITVYWPAINGASAFAHELAKRMAQDHEVSVITQSKEDKHDWLYTPTLDSQGPSDYSDGKVKVHLIGVSRFEKLLLWPAVNLYYSFNNLSFKILCSIFRKKIFTLVKASALLHNYLLDMDYFNYLLYESANSLKIPYIVTPFVHSGLRWHEFSNLRFRLIKNAAAVIALTETEKDWLVKEGLDRNKIHVIKGGAVLSLNYDVESFKRKYHINGNKMVLFIATKRRYKGFPCLLEAMQYVWQRYPDSYFVFIGLQTQESRQLFARYEDRRLIDIGLVNLEEKTAALAACNIFCMPSNSESFGIVFTEAWSMSKPVIAGNCSSTKEIIDDGKNGFIVSQDPKIIAEKILLLLNDEKLCQKMGEAGKEKVLEKYTWEKSAENLKNLYLSLLN